MKRCPQCGQEYGDNTRFCEQDGQTLHTPDVPATRLVQPDQMLGRTLGGRYRFLEKLGQGGMGAVYKAQHVKMNRLTAVKILTSELAHNRQFVARFEREAEMASQIDHPHAVSIYDFGETDDGLVYLAMEFIDGQPLSAILARERCLPLERVVHITRQAAEALSAAHQLGIVHRDFKPDNVMVSNKPGRPDWVKVVDFGIAKRSTIDPAEQLLTQVGAVLGTPQYMSPEQVAGESVDARSDLYSLATVTYEMLCGSLPFEGSSTTNVMMKRVMEAPTPLHQRIRPQTALPPGVEWVIMRALARNPNERYLSTTQFAAELDNAARTPSGYQQSDRYPGGTTPNFPYPTAGAVPPTHLQIERSPAYVAGVSDRNQHPQRSKTKIILAVLALVLVPMLVIGGYFAARYIKGSRDRNLNNRNIATRAGNGNAAVAGTEVAATPVVSVQERIKRSRAAREANDLTTAEQESRAALTANPNSAPANTEFAEVLWELERFDEAEKYVNAALRIDPNFGPAHQALGAVYYMRGDLERAIKEQKLTLQLNPEPEYVAYAHSVLGAIYRTQGRYKDALSEYQAAISSSPRRSIEINPRLGIADIYIGQDRPSDAMTILRALVDSGIAQGNDLAWVNIRIGRALVKMKKLDEGIEHYETALKNATKNNARAEAHLSLGFLYYEQKNYEKGLERALQAIELAKGDNLTSSAAYWLAGVISYQREDVERAIELLEQAQQLNPNDKNIPEWLSLARKKSK